MLPCSYFWGGKWDMMVPSRVIRATSFLEDKITRKDLYYGKVETVIASKSSLPLWDREKARRNHLHCTSCFISVPSHYSIFYFLSLLCPAKLTFERAWIGSKAVLNKWDCFSYWLRWSFDWEGAYASCDFLLLAFCPNPWLVPCDVPMCYALAHPSDPLLLGI